MMIRFLMEMRVECRAGFASDAPPTIMSRGGMSAIACIVVGLCVSLVGCERRLAPAAIENSQHVAKIRESLGGGGAEQQPGAEQALSEPTGWGTLKGVVKLTGNAPAPEALRVDKEVDVCAPGGKTVYSEALVVGSTGGIKDVVIFLATKIPNEEKWVHETAKPGKTDEVLFDQRNCVFLSHVLVMQSSQKLKIVNSDPTGHNTRLSPVKNPKFDQTVPQGGSVLYQPAREEPAPFPVACAIHPWMSSWIMIRDNGYWAVTNEQGEFEIPNLPAGVELEFRIWQEKAKGSWLSAASVNGVAKKLPKGKLLWTVDAEDASKNQLNLDVDAAVFTK